MKLHRSKILPPYMLSHKMLPKTIISPIVLAVLCITYVSCLRGNFLDRNVILRLKREVSPGAESTTRDPDMYPVTPDPDYYPTPVDKQENPGHYQDNPGHYQDNPGHYQDNPGHYQDNPSDTTTPDPDYQGHRHGDTGHSSANDGQGYQTQHSDSGSDPGFHSDLSGHSDYSMHDQGQSFHGDMSGQGQGDYPTGDQGQGHDSVGHSEQFATDMHSDYHNPPDMTRPGEAPPRYLSNVQHDSQGNMPRALPLIQEPTPTESGQDGTQLDPAQGEMTGDPGTDGTRQDTPVALPMTQEFFPETGGMPLALPQKQG